MRERLPWFKCEPSKLLGALAAMEPYEGYIYTVVILRIYEAGGPIPDDVRKLSRRTGLRINIVANALEKLIATGNLEMKDGKIDCGKTHDRLQDMAAVQSKRIMAGKCSASARWGKSQLDQLPRVTHAKHLNNKRIQVENRYNLLGTAVPGEEGLAMKSEPIEVSAELVALNKKAFG